TPPASFDHRGLAADVQKALVLPGKARIREVFGGRRTARRDGHASTALVLEGPIGVRNFPDDMGIAGGLVDELSSRCRPLGQGPAGGRGAGHCDDPDRSKACAISATLRLRRARRDRPPPSALSPSGTRPPSAASSAYSSPNEAV